MGRTNGANGSRDRRGKIPRRRALQLVRAGRPRPRLYLQLHRPADHVDPGRGHKGRPRRRRCGDRLPLRHRLRRLLRPLRNPARPAGRHVAPHQPALHRPCALVGHDSAFGLRPELWPARAGTRRRRRRRGVGKPRRLLRPLRLFPQGKARHRPRHLLFGPLPRRWHLALHRRPHQGSMEPRLPRRRPHGPRRLAGRLPRRRHPGPHPRHLGPHAEGTHPRPLRRHRQPHGTPPLAEILHRTLQRHPALHPLPRRQLRPRCADEESHRPRHHRCHRVWCLCPLRPRPPVDRTRHRRLRRLLLVAEPEAARSRHPCPHLGNPHLPDGRRRLRPHQLQGLCHRLLGRALRAAHLPERRRRVGRVLPRLRRGAGRFPRRHLRRAHGRRTPQKQPRRPHHRRLHRPVRNRPPHLAAVQHHQPHPLLHRRLPELDHRFHVGGHRRRHQPGSRPPPHARRSDGHLLPRHHHHRPRPWPLHRRNAVRSLRRPRQGQHRNPRHPAHQRHPALPRLPPTPRRRSLPPRPRPRTAGENI